MRSVPLVSSALVFAFLCGCSSKDDVGGDGDADSPSEASDPSDASMGGDGDGDGGSNGAASSTGGAAGGGSSSATGGTAQNASGGGPAATGGRSGVERGSPGCGQAGRPTDGLVYDAGESWLVFPEKYDGTTPLPVLFGFHGAGAYNFGDDERTEYWDITRGSEFETEYVVAIPLAASGSAWNYETDIGRAQAVYDELVNNYCVDLDRVFASGHSSGAGFINGMLAEGREADLAHFGFAAMAPVASWRIWNQGAAMPVLYVQSPDDTQRDGDGSDVMEMFIESNGCSETTSAYEVPSCSSRHDDDAVDPGCVLYDGCDVETIWCAHDDSVYSGTFHGIPCFFQEAAFDFFEKF